MGQIGDPSLCRPPPHLIVFLSPCSGQRYSQVHGMPQSTRYVRESLSVSGTTPEPHRASFGGILQHIEPAPVVQG